ncbi:MAG: molybdopterin-dependent oxidoreductase [Deltaproteobacteria bacterium]|nr:molybdopterin-dependent oxidoreductase [Deltaproteobacteria bacterium]
MTVKKVICMQCHNACRLAAQVEENRLVSVEPDEDFPGTRSSYPITKGCPRRRNVIQYFYHPSRLNYPLKRAAGKGENKWQRISWEDAIGEIGRHIRRIIENYGPEAVATTSGTGRTHDEIRQRFFNMLGSPNHTGAGQICYGPFCVMSNVVFGWRVFPVVRSSTKCILLWGGGGPRYWDIFWRSALKAQKEQGAKIIVIDPRGADAAKAADLWLQIRPGTDCALALGMINHIIENELYDESFVRKWCYGFDDLKDRAAPYPVDKVSEITWLPASRIRQAAEWYATLRPGVTNHGMGIEHLTNSIETLHALFSLAALCGNVDVSGGDVFTTPYPDIIHEQEIAAHERLPERQAEKTLGLQSFRLMSRKGYDLIQSNVSKVWGDLAFNRTSYEIFAHGPMLYRTILSGEPYPVRGMITLSSNPMVTAPNTRLVYDALKSLDLYVVVDFFMTPSAQLADYVLPSTTYLERPWLWTYSGVVGSERALPGKIEGHYDRKDDYDFWRLLGLQLGQERDWPWETLEDLYDYRLSPAGLTFREFMDQGGFLSVAKKFKRYEDTGFGTPSGKIELRSNILEELGYDPLPRFYEPPLSPCSRPDLAADYPLILITGGRHQPFYHSEHRQIQSLRKMHPDPIVQVNPETARKLGIEEGDWVWIETQRGRITQKCRYLETLHPSVVHVQHGWWYPEEDGADPCLHGVWKSNCNVLIDDDPSLCNPISGGWPLRALLCKVYKGDVETAE